MSWPAYAEYKDSGVEWLNQIPAGWEAVATRYLCDIHTGDKDTVNSLPDGEFPFYVRSQTVEQIDSWSFDGEAVLTAGDGVGVGKVFHYATGKFDAHQRVYVFNNFRRVLGRYFHYYFSNLFARVALDGGAKSTVDSLRRPVLASFPVSFPNEVNQRLIVTFLDRETAKIDALIAKQEQLIATLREDRAATITQAVTKGLDPDVEMKESSFVWLGYLPAHWAPSKIKHVVAAVSSGTSVNASDVPASRDEIGVLKTSCVSAGWFNPEANKTVADDEVTRVTCPVTEGTLLVNRANTPALVGSSGYVKESRPNLYLSDKIWQVSLEGALAEFIHYWTGTPVYRSQIAANCVGASSSMQNLSMSDFLNTAISLPPADEQHQIVAYLDAHTTKFDALIAKSTEMIATLREYRSALITDAVTGKIDVRGAA